MIDYVFRKKTIVSILFVLTIFLIKELTAYSQGDSIREYCTNYLEAHKTGFWSEVLAIAKVFLSDGSPRVIFLTIIMIAQFLILNFLQIYKKEIGLFHYVSFIIFVGLSIGLAYFTLFLGNNKNEKQSNCENLIKQEFKNNEYKILILDFINYSNEKSNLNLKFQNLIESLNKEYSVQISTKTIECNANALKIYNPVNAEEFCKDYGYDMVIYGEEESKNQNKVIQFKYSINPILQTMNKITSDQFNSEIESIIELSLNNGDFEKIRNTIYWNLSTKISQSDKDPTGRIKDIQSLLGNISSSSDTLYYYGKIISSLFDKLNGDTELSQSKLNEIVNFRPNWSSAFYERSIVNLMQRNYTNAASDYKTYKIVNSECSEDNLKYIYFSSYIKEENRITPETYGHFYPCLYDSIEYNEKEEFGYCLLLQEISQNENINQFFKEVDSEWREKFPNSKYIPVLIE